MYTNHLRYTHTITHKERIQQAIFIFTCLQNIYRAKYTEFRLVNIIKKTLRRTEIFIYERKN